MKKIYQKPYIQVTNLRLATAVNVVSGKVDAQSISNEGSTDLSKSRGSRSGDSWEDLW